MESLYTFTCKYYHQKKGKEMQLHAFFFFYMTHFQFAFFENILNFAIGLELG